MEREMCIYKELLKISKDKSLEDELNDIADYIYKEYGTKINFCKIFGNRWSYCAGNKNLIMPKYRIVLTEDLGLLAENVDEENWNEILQAIKKVIA
ncbi:hypothetical protein [Sporanaerobacter acetigenes]|uniref:Uncharacterized protein n=1 Tax=Sporanaerobacter acetigenes DSM 13106 TaxID=1123281 RepID=A0A1M5T9M0_9FIRM|nr:hypothetical protein [Sporanaerobacter acetigenes]SHH47475.1 hypothetical protein SAMN02745180_00411 [Sporanaerobacter acetigenes DSM 13106]